MSHSTLPGPKCPTTHSSDQDAALLMKTKKGNNPEEGDSSANLDPPDKQEVETDDPNVTPNIPSHKLLRKQYQGVRHQDQIFYRTETVGSTCVNKHSTSKRKTSNQILSQPYIIVY